ncbi:hypothetical protein BHE74_00052712, partial [Ensete ventricosum]
MGQPTGGPLHERERQEGDRRRRRREIGGVGRGPAPRRVTAAATPGSRRRCRAAAGPGVRGEHGFRGQLVEGAGGASLEPEDEAEGRKGSDGDRAAPERAAARRGGAAQVLDLADERGDRGGHLRGHGVQSPPPAKKAGEGRPKATRRKFLPPPSLHFHFHLFSSFFGDVLGVSPVKEGIFFLMLVAALFSLSRCSPGYGCRRSPSTPTGFLIRGKALLFPSCMHR